MKRRMALALAPIGLIVVAACAATAETVTGSHEDAGSASLGAAAAGVAGAGSAAAEAETAPVRCSFRLAGSAGALRLETVAVSDHDATGFYNLQLTTSGPGGTSSIGQGGAVTLAAGRETVLGVVGVGSGAGSRTEGTLTLTVDGTDYACRLVYPLPE